MYQKRPSNMFFEYIYSKIHISLQSIIVSFLIGKNFNKLMSTFQVDQIELNISLKIIFADPQFY